MPKAVYRQARFAFLNVNRQDTNTDAKLQIQIPVIWIFNSRPHNFASNNIKYLQSNLAVFYVCSFNH